MEIVAHLYFFSVACFRAFRDAPYSRCWCRDLKLCLLDFSKMLHLALLSNLHTCIHLWKSVALDMHGLKILAHLYLFCTRVFLRV